MTRGHLHVGVPEYAADAKLELTVLMPDGVVAIALSVEPGGACQFNWPAIEYGANSALQRPDNMGRFVCIALLAARGTA